MNSSNDFRFSSLQYCPARTSHRYLPSSTNRVSRSASRRCSHARISSILVRTNWARFLFSFGSMGGYLEIKLVKPTKVFSGTPDEASVNEFLSAQAQSDIRAGGTRILGKPNSAVWQELACFDATNRVLYQLPKLMALFVGDRGPEVLDLN